MTGTNCDLFTHNQSRSYLNHLVHLRFLCCQDKGHCTKYPVVRFEILTGVLVRFRSLGCNTVSLGDWFPMFWTTAAAFSFKGHAVLKSSMKFCRVSSRVNVIKRTNISRTNSILIFRVLGGNWRPESCGPVFITDSGAGAERSTSLSSDRWCNWSSVAYPPHRG
jgi:hypothetical protein